ncbi:MAG: hypothetical protein AAGI34_03995 [Pseudomonadota bacterium]
MRARLVVLALAALALWWLWPAAPLAARFGLDDCRVLALSDTTTGKPIRGVEDMALADETLILSAYDRLSAGRGEAGGLYRLPLAALAEDGPLALTPVAPGIDHPHGIAAAGGRLAVIARTYGANGLEGAAIHILDAKSGAVLWQAVDQCTANDLAFAGPWVAVSHDRRHCEGLSWREMLLPAGHARVERLSATESATLATALTFANGIAIGPGAGWRLAVAETRAARLTLDPETPRARRLALPGAPDNLSLAPDGRLLAALHPSLWRLALHRHGLSARAPSRAVAVDPMTGAVEVLFDDPGGDLWPGATVAVETPDALVLGAIRAAGVLVCERRA